MVGRRWWRWAGLLAGVVVVGATLLVGLADTLLQPDRYRPQIAAIVERETGRALSLRGPLHVDWSLWPTLRASDVRLANLPGGSRPDMAQAERIEAQISLLSLLRRRIEVTRLTLIGPNILFEQVGGVPNWVFHADTARTLGRSGDRPGGLVLGARFPLEFRAAHLRNGMVTTRFPARTNVIGIRSLDLADPRARGRLSLAAILVYADNQPFGLDASAVPTGRVTDPWVVQVRLAAFDATATATGRAGLSGRYDLQLDALVPRLEALDALLAELRLPALRGVRLSTHLASGPVPGDLPILGRTLLHADGGDLGDRLPGLRLDALDLALPATGGTAALSARGGLGGQPLALQGGLAVPPRLDGRHDAALRLGLRIGPDLAHPAGLVSLDGRLTLAGLGPAGLDAALRLQAPSLAALRPMLFRIVPAWTPPALTAVALAGRLRVAADGAGVALQDASLEARECAVSGGVTVVRRAPLSLSARLHATRLDLDALLPPAASAPASGPAPPPAAGPLIPNDPLPWRALRGPSLDLALRSDGVRLRGQDWPGVDAALRLDGGRMLLSLPGGPLQGTLDIDARTDDATAGLELHAPALPLALLAGSLGLPGPATGSLRLDARLGARGGSAQALASSLAGRLTLAMAHGTLDDAGVRQMAGPALAQLGSRIPPEGETAIRCAGLDGTVAGGIVRISTLALDSSALTVSGEGVVDLGAETVRLRIRPLAHLSGVRVSVPVLIDGPFRSLHGRLQASAFDKLGLFIDAMFGGDHPKTCEGIDLL